jgi:hypothetical protein
VPVIRTINNVTVSGTQCFDATQTIEVAGNGSFFTVQPTGNVTMIAGTNILFYPGSVVQPGGYLHGYISAGGPWCGAPAKPAVAAGKQDKPVNPNNFFRVYPNPTTGTFTLALKGYVPSERTSVEIFNMKGEKVLSDEMTDQLKHDFSLSGLPAGLYFIKVSAGELNGSSRIVKID